MIANRKNDLARPEWGLCGGRCWQSIGLKTKHGDIGRRISSYERCLNRPTTGKG